MVRKIAWTNPVEVAENIKAGFHPVTAKALSFLETMETVEYNREVRSGGKMRLSDFSVDCSCGESKELHCPSVIQQHIRHNHHGQNHACRVTYMGSR